MTIRQRITRLVALGIWLVFAAQCTSIPTSVLLDIRPGVNLPEIGTLGITIFDAEGIAVLSRQIPEAKKAELPSTVVLFPDRDRGRLRILVRAFQGGQFVGEGSTEVSLKAGTQVAASLTVNVGKLPDRDGDGVPDLIDNCPDIPNAAQSPCAPDAGPSDALDDGHAIDQAQEGFDGPHRDGSPQDLAADLFSPRDLNCDVDKDGYISTACGGDDCNDRSAKAHPDAQEGPPGNASCSDQLDNDCDGKKDLADDECVACRKDADCDDGSLCTRDTCISNLCQHTPANEAKTCPDKDKCTVGSRCRQGLCQGNARTCPAPPDPCKVATCVPTTGCGDKDAPKGTACHDTDPCTSGETCLNGVCHTPPQAPECNIAGTCYPDGATQSTCHVCLTSQSTTAWSLKPNTCEIAGACYASGDGLTSAPCHVCLPAISQTTWSLKPNTCEIAGVCYASGASQTNKTCHVCAPSTSQTKWTIAPNTCYIDGVCYQAGASSTTACMVCDPTVSKTAWTYDPICSNKIILVALNEGHTGDLGGISGADALCQQQATAASLTGTYKAFLSTTSQDLINLIQGPATGLPVYNSKGDKLFDSWTAMFPSKWPSNITLWSFDDKEVDENTGASPEWDDADAWHGSDSSGHAKAGLTCGDWKVSSGSGSCGEVDMNSLMTTIETRGCNLALAVLCVRIPD